MTESIMKKNDHVSVFDNRINYVGESPLWHPLRNTLYWVDFPNNLLMSRKDNDVNQVILSEMATAIGWIDEAHLLLAKPTGLYRYHIDSQSHDLIVAIEENNDELRSNDGRADPWGGFWLGTMSTSALANAGSIYRWYQGELKCLVKNITIINAICFDKLRQRAYFADSAQKQLFLIKLNEQGWPISEPERFYDFSLTNETPDGAIVDGHGNLWIALWDSAALVCLNPKGEEIDRINVETLRPTCPAFGGQQSEWLFITSAQYELENTPFEHIPHGTTLKFKHKTLGLFEPKVIV